MRGRIVALFASGLLLMTGLVLCGDDRSALAEDVGVDPKQLCGELTQLISLGELDQATELTYLASRGSVKRESVAVGLSSIVALIRTDTSPSVKFVAEKRYGDAIARVWQLIVSNSIPVYVRCQLINYDGSWVFTGIDLDTSFDKVLAGLE